MKTYRYLLRLTETKKYWNGQTFSTEGEPVAVHQVASSASVAEQQIEENYLNNGFSVECIAAY